jgi:N-acetylglucosamine transport system substrate-binding protein
MKKMKHWLGVLLAVALGVTALAGCGDAGGAATAPPQGESGAAQAGGSPTGELNIAIFEGGYGRAFWDEIVKRFEADNPGVRINMQISPTVGDIVRPQIVAGNVPDFLSMNDNDQTGVVLALIKDRGLMDITDVFDGPQYDAAAPLGDKIIDGFLQSAKCAPYGDGKIYLAPSNGGPMGMVYNKTLFAENGWQVPVTWDEFFALGDLAQEQGIALITYQGIYPGYMESLLFPAIASKIGLEEFKKITSFQPGVWTDPRVIEVLEQFQKIHTGGYLMEGTVALNHTQSQTDQMLNKALFIPNGTWMEGEMADVTPAPGYAFGLTPPPVLKTGDTRYIMSSVEQYSIPAGAKNPALAKHFLRYLYTDDAVRLFAALSGGGVVTTKNALELVKPYLSDGVYGMYGAYDEPNAAAIIVGFDALPAGSKISYNDEIFQPLSDLMTGKMTARQWAEGIDKAYQDIQAGK